MKLIRIFALIASIFVTLGLGIMIGHAKGIEQGRASGAQLAGMNIAKDAELVLNAKSNENGECLIKKSDVDSLRISINKFKDIK